MQYQINTHYAAKNFNHRIRFLVLHYTALDFDASLKVLTQGQVSAHYLVPEGPVDGTRRVFQLVKEDERAWHAGASNWQDRSHINDTSIGIEIVNLGYKDDQAMSRHWFPFSDYQIETAIRLAKDIISRYQIMPTCVLGHSDIAPNRKVDPGPLFPWQKLYQHGIGAWYDQRDKDSLMPTMAAKPVNIGWLQKNLITYGYCLKPTGTLDQKTQAVIKAFQMHFQATHYSGIPNSETCAILAALIKKYYPQEVIALP